MKNKLFYLTFVFPALAIATSTVLAAPTATPSASAKLSVSPKPSTSPSITDAPIASNSEQITADVVEKIKNVVKDGTSTINSPLIGMVGIVNNISVSNNTLTFTNKIDGNRIQVATDSNTAFVSGSKTISLKDVPVDNKIIVIGTSIKTDIILAKRLIVLPEVAASTVTRSVVIGTVTAKDPKAKTISLLKLDQTVISIDTNKKSVPTLDKLSVGDKIIAIVKTDPQSSSTSLVKAKTLPSN